MGQSIKWAEGNLVRVYVEGLPRALIPKPAMQIPIARGCCSNCRGLDLWYMSPISNSEDVLKRPLMWPWDIC